MTSPEVTNNPAKSRYEARIDGHLAGVAVYREMPNAVIFLHTETEPQFEGHGVGGALAKFGLDDTVARGKRIVASCPFIASYVERHPDYQPHLLSLHSA
jgi:predicted GNAT family acetyltransferase